MPIINYLDIPNVDKYLDLPIRQLEERALKIKNNTKLQTRVSDLMTSNMNQYPPPKYIEQTVYSGFASESDSLWMERFHASTWEDRSKLLNGFDDPRYKELAERLLCTSRPEFVSEEVVRNFHEFVQSRLHDKGPWLSLEKCKDQTSKLLENAKGEDKEILSKLKVYLDSI